MKRLYVLPKMRGAGIGQALSLAALDYASKAGYRHVRLETLVRLEAARVVYADLGFEDVERGSDQSCESPIIMQRSLV